MTRHAFRKSAPRSIPRACSARWRARKAGPGSERALCANRSKTLLWMPYQRARPEGPGRQAKGCTQAGQARLAVAWLRALRGPAAARALGIRTRAAARRAAGRLGAQPRRHPLARPAGVPQPAPCSLGPGGRERQRHCCHGSLHIPAARRSRRPWYAVAPQCPTPKGACAKP